MDRTDQIYNDILDNLRKIEPMPADAGELTESVMQKVKQTTPVGRKVRMMRVSGILSGVAASTLIGLLAYETLKYPVLPVEKHYREEPQWTAVNSLIDDTYPIKVTELDNSEKEKIIEKIVKSKEAQRVQKKHLSASFIIQNSIVKCH